MNSEKKYILAIDQSTSATKVVLFNRQAELKHRVTLSHRQYYPQPGFVEHDAEEIWRNTLTAIERVVFESETEIGEIAGIAITNQRETAVIWDKTSGKPVANAVVWQCRRGAEFCNILKENGSGKSIMEKTGLIIDPYFSASKLRWLFENIDGLKQRAKNGNLLVGTMDSWMLWNLTGGEIHATDYSNACRTMLFNINTLEWDNELVDIFGLSDLSFPEVKFSDEIFGYSDKKLVFDELLPISGLIGDSHGAFFGQQCFEPGMGKVTYGTGSSVMMNIGNKPVPPPGGLVTSIGFAQGKEIIYVFEGNIHSAGDTINWLVNELQLINDAGETEKIAISVDSNNGVYLVPAFVGLGAPYWDNDASAAIVGIGRNATKSHVVRAALESIAYQVKDLVDLMSSAGEIKLSGLRVDGGPTRNNFLMQFQCDMLQGKVERSNIEEISVLGATFLAGLATGFWKDLNEIKGLRKTDKMFLPEMDKVQAGILYKGWQNAVAKSRFNL